MTAFASNADRCHHILVFACRIKGVPAVASLSVRKIDDETVAQLRIRAARHGLSMEEEVLRIIKQAVATPEHLGDLAVRLFSPAYTGAKLERPKREDHDPIEFQ